MAMDSSSQSTPESITQTDVKAETETREALVARLYAPVTNASRAGRLARALLGPNGRVWNREGVCSVGEQGPEGQVIFGAGATFAAAFIDATADLTPKRLEALAGPELKAIHSLDSRRLRREMVGGRP